MAYVSPATGHNPTTGVAIPASWGDDVNAAADFLATNKPHALVYNSANISIPDNTNTALTFDSETYDVGGCHSTATNTSRLTVPAGEGGKYVFSGFVEFAGNATGDRQIGVRIDGATFVAVQRVAAANAAVRILSVTSAPINLSAAQYAELVVLQDSGGALNANVQSNYSLRFSMQWVAT